MPCNGCKFLKVDATEDFGVIGPFCLGAELPLDDTSVFVRSPKWCPEVIRAQVEGNEVSPERMCSELDAFDLILRGLYLQLGKPLTSEETAKYLGVSVSHVHKLTMNGKIPYYKPAGKITYFLRKDLDDYMLQNRQPSKAEIEQESINRVLGRKKIKNK